MPACAIGTPMIATPSWSARSSISALSTMMTSPTASARHRPPAACRFLMVSGPTVGTSLRRSWPARAPLQSAQPDDLQSWPVRSIMRSVPSTASTAMTSRSLTLTAWPTSSLRSSARIGQAKRTSSRWAAVGWREVMTPASASESGIGDVESIRWTPFLLSSSAMAASTACERRSCRSFPNQTASVRQSGRWRTIMAGLCMNRALSTLPTIIAWATPFLRSLRPHVPTRRTPTSAKESQSFLSAGSYWPARPMAWMGWPLERSPCAMMMGSRPPAAMRPTGVGGVGGSGRMVSGWGMLGLDGTRDGLRGCGEEDRVGGGGG